MATSTEALHKPANASSYPSAWPWTRLDDICDAIVDCPHSTPTLAESGPFLVRSQDIRSGVFRTETAARVSEGSYEERVVRGEPTYGDLLYSREGTYFGIAAEVPKDTRVCLGQRMVLIRPRPSVVNPRFLRYWLNSPVMAGHIASFREGSVAERLNLRAIRSLPVVVPPLADQERIAGVLGALDDKIELNRRISCTLESIAHAIFKSWFADFDPVHQKMEGGEVGLPPDVASLWPARMTESRLGPIPEGWSVGKLGDIVQVIDCLHSKKPERRAVGGILLQLNNIRDDGLLDVSDAYMINDEDYAKWTSRLEVQEGDCVITNVGRVGAVSQIPPGVRAALGRNMTGLRCQPGRAHPTFLIQALLSDAMRQEMADKTDAGTILEALNVRSIPHLGIVLPPSELVDRFEVVCGPMRHLMERLLLQSQSLARARDVLLPQLLGGWLRKCPAGLSGSAL